MDTVLARPDTYRMGRPKKQFKPLFVGQWIVAVNRRPSEVAKAIGIGESYLSQIISGEKPNPSHSILFSLSEELGVPMNDFYRRPTERDITDKVARLRPDQLSALSDLLDEIKGPRRKKG